MELNEIDIPHWEFGGTWVTPVSYTPDLGIVTIDSALMRPEFAREGAYAADLTFAPDGPSFRGTVFASSPNIIRLYGINATDRDDDAVRMVKALTSWVGMGKEFIAWN